MSARFGTTKYFSNKQEKRVAEMFGGKVQFASGALNEKGDVLSAEFLFECKITSKEFYILKCETWNKIRKEAYHIRKCPVMFINCGASLYDWIRSDFVILRYTDYMHYNSNFEIDTNFSFKTKNFNKQVTLSYDKLPIILSSSFLDSNEDLIALDTKIFRAIVMEEI